MKIEISHEKRVTIHEIIEVPKEYEFYFTKDEDDYTDAEWDLRFDNWFFGRIRRCLYNTRN